MRNSLLSIFSISFLFGDGLVFKAHPISSFPKSTRSVHAVDLDGDGDVDILSASDLDGAITWHKNNGMMVFSDVLIDYATQAEDINAADINADGNIDVIYITKDGTLAWHENNGTSISTTPFKISTSFSTTNQKISVFPYDVDKDGDIDLLTASMGPSGSGDLTTVDGVAWFENNGSNYSTVVGSGFTYHDIHSSGYTAARDIYAADVDNDSDVDIISADYGDNVIVYINDGSQSFSRISYSGANNVTSVFAADVDNDSDVDIVSSSKDDGEVNIFENNGSGSFSRSTIYGQYNNLKLRSVLPGDFNKDNRIDIAMISEDKGLYVLRKTQYFRDYMANVIATDTSKIQRNGDYTLYGNETIFVFDIDKDGDLDIVSDGIASSNDDVDVVWYENLYPNYKYGNYYATFTLPNCLDTLEVGRTYNINWDTNTPSSWNTYLYIYLPGGVHGDFCDNDPHGYSYTVAPRRDLGTIKNNSDIDFAGVSNIDGNSGSLAWTVPSTLNDYEGEYRLVIKFTDPSSSSNTSYLNNMSFYLKADKTSPTITSVSSTVSNGTYGIGDVIPIIITFNEPVVAPQGQSDPSNYLILDLGSPVQKAYYSSGSGTNQLIFNYTVVEGINTDDLSYERKTDFEGNYNDLTGNDANLDLPIDGEVGSLRYNKDIVIDGVRPVISSILPNENSFINKAKVSYSLSEKASSGSVTFTRTGGSADINSPHIVALSGNELTAGAKEGIVLTNSPSLVEGAIYTISFDVKDLAGNSANTQSNSNITFDLKAPTVSNLSYNDNAYLNVASLPFSFSLSEIADSVIATYTRTGGSADPNSPHKLVFGAGSETVALSFNSATSFSAPNLVDGAVYDVSLTATDLAGNASAPLVAKSITFDITPPDIVGIFPKKDDILNSINLSYSLSEDVSNATVTWTSIGTVQDIASPHIKALSGDELKKGTRNNITLSNSPTLVDGAKYTLTLRVTDLAGNVGMPYDISPVTYDFTPPSLKQTSADSNPFVAISKPSKVRLDFTEPIFSYDISISSKMNAKIDTSTSQSADSLIIDFIGPLTSLDTINIEVSNVIDRAGSKSELINVKLFTSLLADFNNDFRVDVADLAALIATWPNVEMGPATGTIPYLTPQPDGKSNLRDIAVFTRLWRWSLNNNGAQRKMVADLGNDPSMEVNSNEIKFNISEDIRSGEVFIDYSRLDGSVSLKNNNIEENKIVIYEHDHEQKFLLLNFGALKAIDDDQIRISIERNNSQESGIDLDYRFFNEFAEIISSGKKEIELAAIPTEFALHNNYPNPFNPTTTMRFDLPIQTDAKVIIFNMLGQKVKTFDLKGVSAGYHSVKWNARNDLGDPVGAGVYFYQLQTSNFTKTKKMVLLK